MFVYFYLHNLNKISEYILIILTTTGRSSYNLKKAIHTKTEAKHFIANIFIISVFRSSKVIAGFMTLFVNPIQDGFFLDCSQICHTYSTILKLCTLAQLYLT